MFQLIGMIYYANFNVISDFSFGWHHYNVVFILKVGALLVIGFDLKSTDIVKRKSG